MNNIRFPKRCGLSGGSAEFEEVIKCLEIENKVVFKRRNEQAKESTASNDGSQEEYPEISSGIKQASETVVEQSSYDKSESTGRKGQANQSRLLKRRDHLIRTQGWVIQNEQRYHKRGNSIPDCLLSSLKDLSMKSNKTTPSRKVRSNSTPSISSEKFNGNGLRLKKEKPRTRRNSTNKIFSERQPKSKVGNVYSNKPSTLVSLSNGDELSEGTNHTLGYCNSSTRNRRASLPSYVNTHRGSAVSPRSPTKKINSKNFLVETDMNSKKLPQRRSSGPETYTSSVMKDTSSSRPNYPRIRKFSLPASKTSEKFLRIPQTIRDKQCSSSENDTYIYSEIPEDLGKDISLEYVLRLWNVRLPKQLKNDLKQELAHS